MVGGGLIRFVSVVRRLDDYRVCDLPKLSRVGKNIPGINIVMKPTNSPTQGQPNPRKKYDLSGAYGSTFSHPTSKLRDPYNLTPAKEHTVSNRYVKIQDICHLPLDRSSSVRREQQYLQPSPFKVYYNQQYETELHTTAVLQTLRTRRHGTTDSTTTAVAPSAVPLQVGGATAFPSPFPQRILHAPDTLRSGETRRKNRGY